VHVLIVIAFIAVGGMSAPGGGGTSIETVEFRSKAKCYAAKAAVEGSEERGNWPPFPSIRSSHFVSLSDPRNGTFRTRHSISDA
jgi:hypothetical protein